MRTPAPTSLEAFGFSFVQEHEPAAVSFDPLDRARVTFVSGVRSERDTPCLIDDSFIQSLEGIARASSPAVKNRAREHERVVSLMHNEARAKGEAEAVRWTQDWSGAIEARKELVQGVLDGDRHAVAAALEKHADPDAIVMAQDPAHTNRLIPMPIGLAAWCISAAVARRRGPEAAKKWVDVARALLVRNSKATIMLGEDPSSPSKSAIAWRALGYENHGSDAVLVRTLKDVGPRLFNDLAKDIPEAVCPGPVPSSSAGWIPGERVPPRPSMAVTLLAGEDMENGLRQNLERYRNAKRGKVDKARTPSWPPGFK